ncbi:unnamed protein product, partial [Brassica rapa subsp. narinosa]
VEKLRRFLVIFYNSTLIVSASSKVNSYKCYGEIVTIERNLNALACNLDFDLKLKAEDMLQKFLKYWDGMKNVNKMLILAAVLDPRKKMTYPSFCFETLYGKDSTEAKEMSDSVLDLLTRMFNEYASRFKGANSESSQAKQTETVAVQESQDHLDRLKLVVEDFGYLRMDSEYKNLVADSGNEPRDELDMYLKEPVENQKLMMGFEFDILGWWKVHKMKFPVLAEMARDLFAMQDLLVMQVSSVASESAFSTSGRILEPYRSCLTHYLIEVLILKIALELGSLFVSVLVLALLYISTLISLEMYSVSSVAFKVHYEQVCFLLKFNKGSFMFYFHHCNCSVDYLF